MNKTSQIEKIKKLLKDNEVILSKLEVRSLKLFGSIVRGERKKNSDLDFLVEFNKKSFDAYMELKFFLEELFKTKIDLVLSNTLKKDLKATIEKESIRVA